MSQHRNDIEFNELILQCLEDPTNQQAKDKLNQIIIDHPEKAEDYFQLMFQYISLSQEDVEFAKATSVDASEDPQAKNILLEAIRQDDLLRKTHQQDQHERYQVQLEAQAQERLKAYLSQQDQMGAINTYSVVSKDERKPKKRFITPIALSMAACVFVGLMLWLFLPRGEMNAVATIRKSIQTEWDNVSLSVDDRLTSDVYRLKSGFVEIEFDQGAVIVLQGPAEISKLMANGVFLQQGKLVANVPDQAFGFTVGSPSADFVDYGTEFGVYVDATSSTLSVFEGQVVIALPNASKEDYISVMKGQSKLTTINSDVIKTVEDTLTFARSLPEGDSPLYFNSNECEPVVQLSFDDLSVLADSNVMLQRRHFEAVSGPHLVSRNNNKALSFNKGQELMIRDAEYKEWREGFSICLWLQFQTEKSQAIFKVFNRGEHVKASDQDESMTGALYLDIQDDKSARLNYLLELEDADHDEMNDLRQKLSTSLQWSKNQWYHVAFTIGQDNVVLYLDGKAVETYPFTENDKGADLSSDVFIFGQAMKASRLTKKYLYQNIYPKFDGCIDDVTLYQCELSANNIHWLYSQKKD